MQNSKKSSPHVVPFIDFVPAEVKETNSENWRIVFYVRIPGSDKKKRYRRRVKKIAGYQRRMRYAKRICAEIDKKLFEGWNPYHEEYAKKEYKPLQEVMDLFIDQSERRCKDHLIRPDSLRAYISYVKNIKSFMDKKSKAEMFTVEFTKKFVLSFLDYIYFEKKRSARTSNNYLAFCNLLATFMKDREYLAINPTEGIHKRKVGKKKREVIPAIVRNEIFKYQAANNPPYLTLCLAVYFCFIRRTEISKLLVKHIDLIGDTIFIPKEISKNSKDGFVTIPHKLKVLLVKHLDGATKDDYLFSSDNFRPGRNKLEPKKISDTWVKMRRVLGFKKEYQFYSLKDTGITQLFLLNVPVIKIRDQARHHDIKITESYTPRNSVCDDTIRDLDFNF